MLELVKLWEDEMKKKLILLTDAFPFSTGETFLENEIPYLIENFDLRIITSDITSVQTRDVDAQVYRIAPKSGYSFFEKIKYTLKFLFSVDGLQEIVEILSAKKCIRQRLLSSLYFYIQSQDFYKQFSKVGVTDASENPIIYAYWANYKLLSFTHSLKWKTIVTRMHGYDLYNERYITGRQPFKNQMDKSISKAVFVSEAGLIYYKENYKTKGDKYVVCRLGTKKPKRILNEKEKKTVFTLCSCSNVIPIKHVELIADALTQIQDIQIKWVHFGDGICFNELKRRVEKFSSNIECELKGRVSNRDVLAYYSENVVDCFITVSETEGGCPVSIMEALSYGVPVIATAVGGIPEMLQNTGNILLPKYPSVEQIVLQIRNLYAKDSIFMEKIRRENIYRWNEWFNEEVNNVKFISILKELE